MFIGVKVLFVAEVRRDRSKERGNRIEQQGKLHGSERALDASQILRGGERGFSRRPFSLRSKPKAQRHRNRDLPPYRYRSAQRKMELKKGPEANLDGGLSSVALLFVMIQEL